MKYILHYVGAMNYGGMENVIMNIYRNIDRTKFQFHFAVHTSEKSDFDNEIKQLGGEIISFPIFRKNPIRYNKEWNKFWKNNNMKYDTFHYHTNSLANITAIKSAKRYGVNKIIVHGHSSYANKGNLQKLHDYLHSKNYKYINENNFIKLAVSHKAKKWMFNDCKDAYIINNGIDYDKYYFNENKRIKIRNELNLNEKFVIGHVGNFLKVKNHEYLLNEFYQFSKTFYNSKLILIGSGPLFNDIYSKVCELDLKNRVIFLGSVDNVYDYLNAMDCFVFPSLFEGMPLSLIEAQINGVSVFYSNTISNEVEITNNIKSFKISENELNKILAIEYCDNKVRNVNTELNKKFDINMVVDFYEKLYS